MKFFQKNFFFNSDTDFKRQKHFKESEFYVPPEPFLLGKKRGCKKINEKILWRMLPHYGYQVELKKVLKILFELPNVYNEIFTYVEKENSRKKGVYTSLFCGNRWKQIFKTIWK